MVKSLDGQSKGYGFITFETEDQAEEIRKLTPKQLEFRSRKLNLGPAIRKINSNSFQPSKIFFFNSIVTKIKNLQATQSPLQVSSLRHLQDHSATPFRHLQVHIADTPILLRLRCSSILRYAVRIKAGSNLSNKLLRRIVLLICNINNRHKSSSVEIKIQ